jgi:hypothetical protein
LEGNFGTVETAASDGLSAFYAPELAVLDRFDVTVEKYIA